MIVVGALSVEAGDADMEIKMVDCWIEIFKDHNYDADDPHVKIQGPKEFSTVKNLEGKDWTNDIESVIVGPNAPIHAMKTRILKAQKSRSRQTSASL